MGNRIVNYSLFGPSHTLLDRWICAARHIRAQHPDPSRRDFKYYRDILNHSQPIILGNFVILVGITLFIQVGWLALIIWISFWIYYERIIFTEEEFLRVKFGQKFLTWAEKTPLIWPRFQNWEPPSMPFSFRTVLRREFCTYTSILATLFFLEFAGNCIEEKVS